MLATILSFSVLATMGAALTALIGGHDFLAIACFLAMSLFASLFTFVDTDADTPDTPTTP